MIRVLIIDDSALVRQLLSEMLSKDQEIEVVGVASDPFVAREKIKKLNPDVLTLDVEMPRMDGITFLRNLMRLRPMPVIMVSSLTERGADITLQAMELGAIDFVTKPQIDLAHTFENYAQEINAKVKLAAKARLHVNLNQGYSLTNTGTRTAVINPNLKTTDTLLAIGASTGGTEAIKAILSQMPANSPGTVIAQHIPETFSAAFAQRLNNSSSMTVTQAKDGQQIVPGHAYVAPGNLHLSVVRDGARFICKLGDGPPVNRHKPSVDVLFSSVAEQIGHNSIGVILTGMGDDGARGLKQMHDVGAPTIAQDESSSVVWGMPKAAVKLDAADNIIALSKIAGKIQSIASNK